MDALHLLSALQFAKFYHSGWARLTPVGGRQD